MPASTTHTYLKTRATVMAKKLFSPARLEQLVQNPLQILYREFELGDPVAGTANRSGVNRATERSLIHILMHELGVLLRPLGGNDRDILIHWSRKFELYNLKALIRGKFQRHSPEDIEQNLFDLPSLISLPHDRLLRTESVLELLRQLEESHFADIARQARQVYEEKNEPFSLDAAIDRSYYLGLLRRLRRISEADRIAIRQLIGTMIDHQNLNWLLRYRFSYGLSPSETYYLLLPFGRHLHHDRLMELVNLETFDRVIDALPGPLGVALAKVSNLLELERWLEHQTALQARRCLSFSPSAVTRSLAYLVLREMDLKKLYAILQGKVLELQEGLIRAATGIESSSSDREMGGSLHV